MKKRWGRRELDIFIPSLKIGIEYDGSYYHKDMDRDKRKNKFFKDIGITIIRVRENPLVNIEANDILLSSKELCKKHINNLLSVLLSIKNLNPHIIKDIITYKKANYFENEQLFNELSANYNLPPVGRSLAERYPKLAAEWCQELNGIITPQWYLPTKGKKDGGSVKMDINI